MSTSAKREIFRTVAVPSMKGTNWKQDKERMVSEREDSLGVGRKGRRDDDTLNMVKSQVTSDLNCRNETRLIGTSQSSTLGGFP